MMTMAKLRISYNVLLFTILISKKIHGTPVGAPLSACDTMTPIHSFQPQTSPSPYTVVPSLQSDNSVRLTLIANSGSFRGYLVMGFDNAAPSSVIPIGSFSEIVSEGIAITPGKYLDCSSRSKSAATHNFNSDKQIVNLLWIPPPTFNGTVAFKTTFVKEVATYWVKTDALETVDIIISAEDTTTATPVMESTTTKTVTPVTVTDPSTTTTRPATTPSRGAYLSNCLELILTSFLLTLITIIH